MSSGDSLSVILPVYNERSTIETVIGEWRKELNKRGISFQLIICEDGSTDGTKELLNKIKNKYNLLLSQKDNRRGYGGAIIDGVRGSKTPYILSVDSDGQCDPRDFIKFWRSRQKADVIIGWRRKRADALQRKLFSFFFGLVFNLLFLPTIHDPSTPFVLYKKSAIMPYLNYLRYLNEGFWWGFVGMCRKKEVSIYELPIHHRKRSNGETVVFKINKIPMIAIRNLIGLIRLKLSQ